MSAPLPDGHLTAIGAVFLVFQNLRAFVLQITGKQKDAWKRCLSMSTFISVNCFTITWKPLFQKLSIRFRSLCLSLSLYLSLSIALSFSFTFDFSVSLPLPLLPFFALLHDCFLQQFCSRLQWTETGHIMLQHSALLWKVNKHALQVLCFNCKHFLWDLVNINEY